MSGVPSGTRQDVREFALSDEIELLWFEDGHHDIKSRESVTGLSAADQIDRGRKSGERLVNQFGWLGQMRIAALKITTRFTVPPA
jgi:predicted alpha/beta-hydrolase family hydrolase